MAASKAERKSDKKPSRRGQHPNSRKNLKPPFTSETAPRNGGRPKNQLAVIGNRVFSDPRFHAALAKRLLSVRADPLIKLVAEYTYGKPEQPITGDKDKPIEINVNIRKVGS
jgi:hypothetical protein